MPEGYRYVQVPDTDVILHIDIECEKTRVELFTPLLFKHGRVYKHSQHGGRYPIAGPQYRCFDKAIEWAKKYNLTYVEGFMVFKHPTKRDLCMGHAWCVDAQDQVVDPTAFAHCGRPNLFYVGIPIRTEYADKWKDMTDYYGCMDGYFDGTTAHRHVGIYADDPSVWVARRPLQLTAFAGDTP